MVYYDDKRVDVLRSHSNWDEKCPEGHSRCFACGVVSMFPEPEPCVTCGRKDKKVCNQCGYIESASKVK